MRNNNNLSVSLELIELRQAVIGSCKDLRAACDALTKNSKPARVKAIRILASAVDRLYGVSLRHAKAHGYTRPAPRGAKGKRAGAGGKGGRR